MKNRFLFSRGLILLFCCLQSILLIGQTKSTTIGTLKNNSAVITDASAAKEVLSAGLPRGAYVTNLRIIGPDDQGKYYLAGNVVGASFSGKAIELDKDGPVLEATDGPGLEVECHGRNCNSCVPKIVRWKVHCACENVGPSESPSDAECDMTSKLIITTW